MYGNKLTGTSSSWETLQGKQILGNTFAGNKLSGKSSSWETLQGEHFLIKTSTGNQISGKSSSWEANQEIGIFLETLVREINYVGSHPVGKHFREAIF